jgi:hypothetical protein
MTLVIVKGEFYLIMHFAVYIESILLNEPRISRQLFRVRQINACSGLQLVTVRKIISPALRFFQWYS